MNDTSITTAQQLLRLAVAAVTVDIPECADLIDRDTGALIVAANLLERGDVLGAIERLQACELLAKQPLPLPANHLATKQRRNLLRVATSAKKLLTANQVCQAKRAKGSDA